MAQHDYNLSNNTGALFRADLNTLANAIATVNSGATEPAVKFPGMLWLDVSGGGDGVVRRRNQANTAWLTDIGIDQTARDAAAAAQTTANAAMPKAGGTFTGPINLPVAVPTNNQAVSRAQADLLYQVVLPVPIAGSLLVGAAGGWQSKLDPGIAGSVLALSGGLPTWSVPATTATPNALVKTLADGTIDASLIPSVASGLKYRGTFKPVVNAEYPTTGGGGAAGAPTIGDFWVIDGLTTGGYTYLTGSLAGVTVYNGDSIAKSDPNWYKMGSTVNLQGYLKTDGSVAMAGDLDMAAHSVINIGGLIARSGTLVPFNGFNIDATNVVVSPQRGATGADLAPMVAGQLGTDIGRMQLFVGGSSANVGMIPVRYFSATAAYAAGEYVWNAGRIYRAKAAVAAGAFTASQWWRTIESEGAENIYGPLRTVSRSGFEFGSPTTLTRQYYLDHDDTTWAFNTADAAGAFAKNAFSVVRATGEVQAGNIQVGLKLRVMGDAGFYGPLVFINQGYDALQFQPGGGYTFIVTARDNGQWIFYDSKRAISAALYESVSALTGAPQWSFAGGVIATSGLQVNDRVTAGTYYTFYGQSGIGRIYHSGFGNDVMTFDATGSAGVAYNLRVNNVGTMVNGCVVVDRNDSAQNWLWYAQGGETHWYHNTVGLRMRLSYNGNLTIVGSGHGTGWFNDCDARLKSGGTEWEARDLDIPLYRYTRDSSGAIEVGVYGQDVQAVAPEHTQTVEGSDGEPIVAVNMANLALEIAMNARDRVIALEAAVAALTPPTATEH